MYLACCSLYGPRRMYWSLGSCTLHAVPCTVQGGCTGNQALVPCMMFLVRSEEDVLVTKLLYGHSGLAPDDGIDAPNLKYNSAIHNSCPISCYN